MGGSGKKKYLIIKKKDLIGWLKIRILIIIDLINIVKFLWENFIYWYKIFTKLINNRDSKNKV